MRSLLAALVAPFAVCAIGILAAVVVAIFHVLGIVAGEPISGGLAAGTVTVVGLLGPTLLSEVQSALPLNADYF